MKITFNSAFTIGEAAFTKGESFSFKENGVNLISGTNGSGKTTLLKALRQHQKDVGYHVKNKELQSITSITGDYSNIFSYFSKEDDSKGAAIADMGLFLKLGGLQRMRTSSGEGGLISISMLVKSLKDSGTKDNLILLDGPCNGFDLNLQIKFLEILAVLSGYGTVVCATHNYFLLEHFGSFNMNSRKKMLISEILLSYT